MQDWKKIVEQAEHYKAIDMTEISLYYGRKPEDIEPPYSFVTSVEEGGTYRWNASVSLRFVAQHPCGLTFRWFEDIEPKQCYGNLAMDLKHWNEIKAKVPASIVPQIQEAMQSFVEAMDKQATEAEANAVSLRAAANTAKTWSKHSTSSERR